MYSVIYVIMTEISPSYCCT